MTKPAVRELARELGLEVADKHDSQDICFVPQGKYADVIRRMHPEAQAGGEIVHLDGRVLGTHDGIVNYTVGQRKGLGIAAEAALCGQARPQGRAGHRRAARGADDQDGAAARRELARRRGAGQAAGGNGLPVEVKVRSTRPPQQGAVQMIDGEVFVTLFAGEYGISPGQACVFYADEQRDQRSAGRRLHRRSGAAGAGGVALRHRDRIGRRGHGLMEGLAADAALGDAEDHGDEEKRAEQHGGQMVRRSAACPSCRRARHGALDDAAGSTLALPRAAAGSCRRRR